MMDGVGRRSHSIWLNEEPCQTASRILTDSGTSQCNKVPRDSQSQDALQILGWSKSVMDKKPYQLTRYEKNQSFNSLVSFLHSTRYKYLTEVFDSLPKTKTLKVVDIGCSVAKTFEILNNSFMISYVGIELDENLSETARQRYGSHQNFKIFNASVEAHFAEFQNADVILALETLEHIPEHIVVGVIEQIALAKPQIFMCSVPNEVGPIVFVKNIGSLLTGYSRHREYKWSETFYASMFNLDKIEVHSTGHKGFDWRWLAQTIRHNIKITKTYSNPIRWLPKTFSFSVVFICLQK
jgi:SAM-dependent methyltransferase